MARTLNPAAHVVRRDAFVDAAQRLLQTKGYEQMSIQDVLDEVEASRGAFYHYFDSKQAVLEAVVDRMVDTGLAAASTVVADPALPAIQKLEGFFGGIGRFKTEQRALTLALLKVWISDDNALFREKLRRTSVARLTPIFTQVIQQGVDEGVFDTTSLPQTVRILITLLMGMQEMATELFIARQAGTVTYEQVRDTFAGCASAFGRVLGAPEGSIRFMDEDTLREWFG